MKLGVIARADDRGLGNQTWEVARNLNPERVLVVRSPGSERQGFEPHLDRFPGATVVTDKAGALPEDVVREWLDGLDVVYSAECLYDVRLADWAHVHGVATVIHANPEFFRPDDVHPTAWWSATDWRLDTLPEGARVVPMPAPIDRFDEPDYDLPMSVLHVGGRPATGDRNGTDIALAVAGLLPDVPFTVTSQSDLGSSLENVTVTRHQGDYWTLYADHTVLLMPRRYGGLCLPVIEASAAGLAPIMLDVDPNRAWPAELVPATPAHDVRVPAGPIKAYQGDPHQLADLIRASGPTQRQRARDWAEAHSWDALRPVWLDELGRAAEQAKERKTKRARANVEVIVPVALATCEYRRRAWAHLRERWAGTGWDIIESPGGDPWVKADAVNQAIEASAADVVVVADADVWCDGIMDAVAHVIDHGGWAVPHGRVHRLTEDASARVMAGEPLDLDRVEQDPYRGVPGGGLVVIDRSLYLDIPMDSRFVGWGGEDECWGFALQKIHGVPWRGTRPLMHLWHPPQERRSRGRGSVDTENLRHRYQRARHSRTQMLTLITEAKEVRNGIR